MSQNPYLDAQTLLKEMIERYEEMFAQFFAIRSVFLEKQDVSLLGQYAKLVLQTDFRSEVHAKFVPLYAEVAALSEKTDIHSLLSQIPLVPKERKPSDPRKT